MKLNLRRAITSASVLAIAGGVLAATAGIANAATTPPWEPDVQAIGTLTFYNSAGQVVTSGNNLANLFAFAQASTADATNGTKANLVFAAPVPNVATGNFFTLLDSTTNFPDASAPPPLNTSNHPLAAPTASQANLANLIAQVPAQTAAGFANVFQVRLYTSGLPGTGTGSSSYWDADVQVNPSNGTWTQIYPAVVTPTTTTLSAVPSTASTGQSVTLTATETPATPGSVVFKDGAATLGTQPVNGSGVATMPTTFSTTGSHALTATFTPTDTADFGGSTGNATETVTVPSTPTTTSLAVTQSGTAGTDIKLSSTVVEGPTAPAPGTPVQAGTVSWFDNGSTTPLNTTGVAPDTTGTATLDIPAGLAAGAHSIIAVFTPTNPANFESSNSAAQQFVLQPVQTGACAQTGSSCTDTQNIEATIPVGTLTISTPYTVANPLNLGTLALNSTLSAYNSTPMPFGNITVVDNRSGDLPWTVTALASNLSDGGSHAGSTICGQNVGLVSITSTPGAGFAGTVTGTNNPAASPVAAPPCTGTSGLGGATAHTVATASAGLGTDVLNGTINLNAPTSTEPGLFTGTITFTVG